MQEKIRIDKITRKLLPSEKPKILIIDDDQIIRISLHYMINKILVSFNLDYDIIEGNDGHDLIDYVNDDIDNNIKIIFTDENMPLCEGSDAIKLVNNILEIYRIKVISLTSIDDFDYIEKILKCGVNEVISKPLHMKTLERVMRHYIR
jgi:YesN/AraC family two-component response regulator